MVMTMVTTPVKTGMTLGEVSGSAQAEESCPDLGRCGGGLVWSSMHASHPCSWVSYVPSLLSGKQLAEGSPKTPASCFLHVPSVALTGVITAQFQAQWWQLSGRAGDGFQEEA